jgi:cell division septum initiation protein DivIVA
MSETAPGTTELTSQYSNQVADDLERNLKEQERLSGEIEALQGQLAALRQDHAVLLNIQQVLGTPTPADSPSTPPGAVVPAPRKKAAAPDERTGTRKSTARAGKQTEKKTGKKAAAKASTVPSGATLVDLVREHLAGQREPRSAAEICTALGGAYPERTIKTTVVRTTLEGLVARNQAQRTKQGSSVFYTSPDASEAAAQTEDGSQQTD